MPGTGRPPSSTSRPEIEEARSTSIRIGSPPGVTGSVVLGRMLVSPPYGEERTVTVTGSPLRPVRTNVPSEPETTLADAKGLLEKVAREQGSMVLPEACGDMRPKLTFGLACWKKGDDMRKLLRDALNDLQEHFGA